MGIDALQYAVETTETFNNGIKAEKMKSVWLRSREKDPTPKASAFALVVLAIPDRHRFKNKSDQCVRQLRVCDSVIWVKLPRAECAAVL